MTEAEAWREIGQAFETPPGKRTKWQTSLAFDGLCFAITYGGCHWYGGPVGWPTIYGYTYEPLRLFSPDEAGESGYFWPTGREGDLNRAVAAYFLAEMAS
jgi:hypothetical protein